MKRLIFFVFVVVNLIGCSGSIQQSELAGTYIAEYSYAREVLELRVNGTYTQGVTFSDKKNSAISNSGSWKYNLGEKRVLLENPILIDDNFGKLNPNYKQPVSGGWHLTATRDFGGIALNWNDDLGVRFKKSNTNK